jgi:hypothetical protein
MTCTPIARYFGTPGAAGQAEGFNNHVRVDCVVRKHKLAPECFPLGKSLVAALIREKIIAEPIWLSVHSGEELAGEAFGEVFDFE